MENTMLKPRLVLLYWLKGCSTSLNPLVLKSNNFHDRRLAFTGNSLLNERDPEKAVISCIVVRINISFFE